VHINCQYILSEASMAQTKTTRSIICYCSADYCWLCCKRV